MLLSDEEIQERLESPLNLLNRLKNATTQKPSQIPCLPPKSEDLDLNIEESISVSQIRNKAAAILAASLDGLQKRIHDVEKPERLARIAAEMNKVVSAQEDKSKNQPSQIIVYAPQVIQESHFQEIVLRDDNP